MTCTMDFLLNMGLSSNATYEGSFARLKSQCKYLDCVVKTITRQQTLGYSARLEWIIALDANTRLGEYNFGYPDILNCIEIYDRSYMSDCYLLRTKTLVDPLLKLIEVLVGTSTSTIYWVWYIWLTFCHLNPGYQHTCVHTLSNANIIIVYINILSATLCYIVYVTIKFSGAI
mgnify:CR=1 FL=1